MYEFTRELHAGGIYEIYFSYTNTDTHAYTKELNEGSFGDTLIFSQTKRRLFKTIKSQHVRFARVFTENQVHYLLLMYVPSAQTIKIILPGRREIHCDFLVIACSVNQT